MVVYSGNALKEYVDGLKKTVMEKTGLATVNERDFVDKVRRDCFGEAKWNKVYIICGLWGMGKTLGLLQTIEDYDNAIYIRAERGEPQTGRDYIEFLRVVKTQNIIIDEYSWIKDNHDLSYYLWTLTENGKRIAITGTHTLPLDYLEDGKLINRCVRINVNDFSFDEYCRVYQKDKTDANRAEYIKNGGILGGIGDNVVRYIHDALVVDILTFNERYFTDADETVSVCDVLYHALKGTVINAGEYPETDYRPRLGLDISIKLNSFRFKIAVEVLEKARVVEKTYTDRTELHYTLHLVNQTIAYQLAQALDN